MIMRDGFAAEGSAASPSRLSPFASGASAGSLVTSSRVLASSMARAAGSGVSQLAASSMSSRSQRLEPANASWSEGTAPERSSAKKR
jgi:hypothetical protein